MQVEFNLLEFYFNIIQYLDFLQAPPGTRLVHDLIRNPGVPKIGVCGKFAPKLVDRLLMSLLMKLVEGRFQGRSFCLPRN